MGLILHFLYKLDYDVTTAITTFQEEEANQNTTEPVSASKLTTFQQPTPAPGNASSALDVQTETPEPGTANKFSLSSYEVSIQMISSQNTLDNAC